MFNEMIMRSALY